MLGEECVLTAGEVVLVCGTVRVLVAERDTRVRAALRTLLGATGGIDVVAEAESRAGALVCARSQDPDVVLVGLWPSGDDDGLALVRTLTSELGIPVVAISFEKTARESALDAGASWFLDHNGVLDDLLDVLRGLRTSRMT